MKNLIKLTNKKLNTKSIPLNNTEAIQIVMPFILKGARRWCRNHLSYMEDFTMSGIEGALEAYNRFKGSEYEERGYLYSSFAYFWIRAKQQDLAHRLWKYLNNTTQVVDDDADSSWIERHGGASTEDINTDLIDMKRIFNTHLTPQEQHLLYLRVEGHTFDHIAEECGYENLHKARNHYLKTQQKIESKLSS